MSKVLRYLLPLSFLSFVWVYLFIYMPNEEAKFTRSKLNNKVIKIKPSYMAGASTLNYHLDNDIIITFSCESKCIVVGDSIVKGANTNVFDVYRKINNFYTFQNKYDANKFVD